MTSKITLSLDAMGGDLGPDIVIPGAHLSSIRHPDLHFIFVGNEAKIAPLLAAHARLKDRSKIIHTDVAIKMDDKPSQALRAGRWKSSMWIALEAVKSGEAQACVSAGNTGALMAMSKFCLRNFEGVKRPAIAAIWPTIKGETVVLDVGASIGADAGELVDMAILGGAMARALFDLDRPRVALLNIGVEEVKGLEPVKEAAQILKDAKLGDLNYIGFIEGNDIGQGHADVVVTEGFAGNIALKTAEGTAKQISHYLRNALSRTLMSKLGALLARGAFRALRDKLDPRKLNGGVFLGLNGIVIKSHGGTDAFGFASAIDLGYDMAKHHFLSKISDDLQRVHADSAKPQMLEEAV